MPPCSCGSKTVPDLKVCHCPLLVNMNIAKLCLMFCIIVIQCLYINNPF